MSALRATAWQGQARALKAERKTIREIASAVGKTSYQVRGLFYPKREKDGAALLAQLMLYLAMALWLIPLAMTLKVAS